MSDTILKPKASETQREILIVAADMFAAEGFRNTDVQVIADRAGVGKGTVYRHFGNKEQLFLATAQYCMGCLEEHVTEQLEGYPTAEAYLEAHRAADLLRLIARACAHFYQQNPLYLEILIQERVEFREANDPLQVLLLRKNARAGLHKLMETAIKSGDLRKGKVKSASDAFSDLLYGSLVQGSVDGDSQSLVQRVEQSVELLLNGLLASPS
jgi:AcrR family transcriptional regulator